MIQIFLKCSLTIETVVKFKRIKISHDFDHFRAQYRTLKFPYLCSCGLIKRSFYINLD